MPKTISDVFFLQNVLMIMLMYPYKIIYIVI